MKKAIRSLSALLASLMIISALCVGVSFAENVPSVTLTADSVSVVEGTQNVTVNVVMSGLGETGCYSCKFKAALDGGATVTGYNYASLGGNQVAQLLENSTVISFMWVGSDSNARYDDTVVLTFTVALPANAKNGDVFNITVIPSADNDDFLDAEDFGRGGVGVNGVITVQSYDEIVISPVDVETKICDESFDVEIWAKDIPACGLASCKFTVEVENAEAILVVPADLGGFVENAFDGDKANFIWIAATGEGIYNDSLIATVSFKLKDNVKSGDTLAITVTADPDSENYVPANDQTPAIIIASGDTGEVKVTGHTLEHFEYTKPNKGKNGHIEYWRCTSCGKYFKDAAATIESTAEGVLLLVGDVNQDGKFNAKDVTYLMKALTGSRVADPAFADFNGDGKVNAKDVTAMMKYLVNMD